MLFIVDFDGTISQKDTLDAMLERFADPAWETLEQSWLAGEIDAVECMSQQVSMIRADQLSLEKFFREIKLDYGFKAFYQYASQIGKVIIASDGLDQAIKISMQHAGFPSVPFFSNHLNYEPNGIKMTFPNRQANCQGGNGNCKCAVAQSQKQYPNEKIVLVGDGKSDACIAAKADVVFAKGKLIKHCETHNIPHTPFSNFEEVLAHIITWPEGKSLAASF